MTDPLTPEQQRLLHHLFPDGPWPSGDQRPQEAFDAAVIRFQRACAAEGVPVPEQTAWRAVASINKMIRHDRFQGPVELLPPTLDTILRKLGAAEAEQRAAVDKAVQERKLAPLELDALRKAGLLD